MLADDDLPADWPRLVDVPDFMSSATSFALGVFFMVNMIECGELQTQDFSSLLVESRLKGLIISDAPTDLRWAAAD